MSNKKHIELNNQCIMITGAAGFIGFHLVQKLLKELKGIKIIGLDSMTEYTPIELKKWRLNQCRKAALLYQADCSNYTPANEYIFEKIDISDKEKLENVFFKYSPDIVVNLAAQAGVRNSITDPYSYVNSNLVGMMNVLECCRNRGCSFQHLVFASSSSVYGGNQKIPFAENDFVDHPVSLYAATKKSDELLAYSYSSLYGIPMTGLRFFTVYGPAGRHDMAYFSFTERLRGNDKIRIFNFGDCRRDFTYIDDIVEGIFRVIQSPPGKITDDNGFLLPPYSIYNIGNCHPENLMDFVHILAEELIRAEVLPGDFDIENHIEKVPMQLGDVPVTYADTSKLERDFGFKPATDLRTGLRRFAEWYKDYYRV